MNRYRIAQMNVAVSWENEARKDTCYLYHDCIVLPRSLEAFRDREMLTEPDLAVTVHERSPYIAPVKSERIYNEAFSKQDDKMILTIFDPLHLETPGYSISMAHDYATVDYTPHVKEYEQFDLQWVMIPFEGRTLHTGGVVLHGAGVEHQGQGIIFSGLSGAGKSTQAHLWQKHRHALIINGDCPVIRLDNGIPKLYGTPWCGTSGESINRSTPLKAVVLVKQGDKNTVRKIEGKSAFLAVLSNVFRSNFDENALDLTIKNLETIVEHIEVFELTCTISEDAVSVLENALRLK